MSVFEPEGEGERDRARRRAPRRGRRRRRGRRKRRRLLRRRRRSFPFPLRSPSEHHRRLRCPALIYDYAIRHDSVRQQVRQGRVVPERRTRRVDLLDDAREELGASAEVQGDALSWHEGPREEEGDALFVLEKRRRRKRERERGQGEFRFVEFSSSTFRREEEEETLSPRQGWPRELERLQQPPSLRRPRLSARGAHRPRQLIRPRRRRPRPWPRSPGSSAGGGLSQEAAGGVAQLPLPYSPPPPSASSRRKRTGRRERRPRP